jgi:hypothetical protein
MKAAYVMNDPIYRSTNIYMHPDYASFKIRRVLFAPIKNETSVLDVDSKLAPVFLAELSKINKFEIVPTPEYAVPEFDDVNVRRDGKFYKIRIFDFGSRFNADAILFTHITRYNPYEPCALGISAQLIHASSGTVVWAINELYDGNSRDVEHFARYYYYRHLRYSHPLLDWKVMMVSMQYFSQMVAFDVASTITNAYRPEYTMDAHILKTLQITEDTVINDIDPSGI